MGKLNILLTAILFVSCANNNTTQQAATGSAKNATPANYYKRLEGTIGNTYVVLHLTKYHDDYDGNYYDTAGGAPVSLYLSGDSTTNRDTLYLTEDAGLRSYDNDTDASAAWHVTINNDSVTGIWINPATQEKKAIRLAEKYPAGSTRFTVVAAKDSVLFAFQQDSAVARSSAMYLEPDDDAAKPLFLSQFQQDSLPQASFTDLVKFITASSINGYRSEMDSMRKNKEIEDTGTHYSYNWEDTHEVSIIYNDNDYVVMNAQYYMYTGGAHGMPGSEIICMDVKNKKRLQLQDVLAADSAVLQPLLEKNYRLQQGLGATDSLNKVLFENNIPPNGNFYFTNKKLGFVYQPYELAAYAYGFIKPYIPFTALMPYLNKNFAGRMVLR